MYVNARAVIERYTSDGLEVLLQYRDKPRQRRQLELPGGQVEDHEPLLDALRREVWEETGLEVTEIEGHQTRVVCTGEQAVVECVQPFTAYQTLSGPVPSMGLYFRCRAHGTLQSQHGETSGADWLATETLRAMLENEPERLSWVNHAGVALYLAQAGSH